MPLPSSDRRKDTLHFGDSSFTVWCMILEKLKKTRTNRYVGEEEQGRQAHLKTLKGPSKKESKRDGQGRLGAAAAYGEGQGGK